MIYMLSAPPVVVQVSLRTIFEALRCQSKSSSSRHFLYFCGLVILTAHHGARSGLRLGLGLGLGFWSDGGGAVLAPKCIYFPWQFQPGKMASMPSRLLNYISGGFRSKEGTGSPNYNISSFVSICHYYPHSPHHDPASFVSPMQWPETRDTGQLFISPPKSTTSSSNVTRSSSRFLIMSSSHLFKLSKPIATSCLAIFSCWTSCVLVVLGLLPSMLLLQS